MFTGLVQTKGTVASVARTGDDLRVQVACDLGPFTLGESIAVDGVCLTVNAADAKGFVADASNETLDKTNLGSLKQGDHVHLERALALGDHLGGHLVTGHVDGVGQFASKETQGECVLVRFTVPELLRPFIAAKGSVTVNGVSLTVNQVQDVGFEVMLVPHTLNETTFGAMAPGASINIEVDVLAKYVASLLGKPGVDGSGARK